MRVQTMPHFSDFALLRLCNPVCFYAAKTQEQMVAARKFHGSPKFYDLMQQDGGSFTVDEE